MRKLRGACIKRSMSDDLLSGILIGSLIGTDELMEAEQDIGLDEEEMEIIEALREQGHPTIF